MRVSGAGAEHPWWEGMPGTGQSCCRGFVKIASGSVNHSCFVVFLHPSASLDILASESLLTLAPTCVRIQGLAQVLMNRSLVGTSLLAQWLGLHVAGVQSLVGELRSHKPFSVAKKKKN